MSKAPQKRLPSIRTALIALAATLLALGALEITLRAMGYRSYGATLSNYRFDPEIGWTTIPGWKSFRSNYAYAHFSYYGSDGEPRTKETWHALPAGGPRTVLIGDSYPEGFYVPYEKSFAYLLGQRARDSTLMNLGVAGYSPDQYLLAARRKLRGVKVARILVFLYPFNDLAYMDQPDLYGMFPKPVLSGNDFHPVNLPLKEPRATLAADAPKLPALESILLPWIARIAGIETPPLPSVAKESVDFSGTRMLRALNMLKQIKTEFPSPCFEIFYVPSYWEYEAKVTERNRGIFEKSCRIAGVSCSWPEKFGANGRWQDRYLMRDNQHHFSEEGSREYAESVELALSNAEGCALRSP